jgi:hypothetical protein
MIGARNSAIVMNLSITFIHPMDVMYIRIPKATRYHTILLHAAKHQCNVALAISER